MMNKYHARRFIFGATIGLALTTTVAVAHATTTTQHATYNPLHMCYADANKEHFDPYLCNRAGLPSFYDITPARWCDEDMICWIGSNADGRTHKQALDNWYKVTHIRDI